MAAALGKAIITGATGGLGSAFAHYLAAQGYDLLLMCKYQHLLDIQASKLKEDFPVEIDTIAGDLADKARVDEIVKEIQWLKRVDYLINCAGYSENKRFSEESIEAVLKMIDVHVCSTVQLVHAVLPGMMQRKSGAIITVSSLAAFLPAPGSSIYSATKSFLNSFMESIYMEVHEYGIKVQALCPGLTHTNFHARSQSNIDTPCIDLWMEADAVVRHSFHDLEDGNVISVPGFVNKSVKNTVPVLPRKFYYKLAEKINKEKPLGGTEPDHAKSAKY